MGSCYSGDHITDDHIHMEIKRCNIEETQKKNRLGMVSKRLLGKCKIGTETLKSDCKQSL